MSMILALAALVLVFEHMQGDHNMSRGVVVPLARGSKQHMPIVAAELENIGALHWHTRVGNTPSHSASLSAQL
jgi:hypothetical protein